MEDGVVEFLSKLGEERGKAYATCFVHEHTELDLRNDEEGIIKLPPC